MNDNTDCSLAARANASSLIILLNRFVIPLPLPSPWADNNIYPTVGFINVCHSRALISLAPSAMVFKPDQGTEKIIIHNLQRDTHWPRPRADLG